MRLDLMKQKFISRPLILAPVILVLFLIFGGVRAATPVVEELRGDISEKQQQLDQIRAEIQNLQREITQKQREVASLANEVALYDLQIRQTENQIRGVELEIQKYSAQILETQIVIQEKTEQFERQKEFLAETLRLINEYDSTSPLEITLGNDTFSEFLDQVQYATNLQEKNQEVLITIKTLKEELEQKKEQLKDELAKQEEAKVALDAAKHSLDAQRAGKNALLVETRGQEKIYKTLLSQAAQKQEQVEREIFEIEVEVRRRIGDKTLPPIRGVLRWPMSGVLTQGYGRTGFTALGYNFHNGIDIAAPAGIKVYAAGDGLIFATGTGEAAYGNWVVIKHTIAKDGQIYNIYTLYAHLQRFIVASGQAVRGGDLIGFQGNTGNTTRLLYGEHRGYHLHFTVFDEEGFGIKEGSYQHIYGPYRIPFGYTYNPMNFLQ